MTRPPAQLLAAYDLDPGRLRPLRGGQGTAWSAGNLILKPLDMPLDELAWQEQILSHIREDGFRLARPVRALDGQLAVEGWSAWQRIEGEHLPRRWAEICAAGQRFHRASAGIPVPGWHQQRNDVFAQADLAAWDDAALSQFCSLAPVAQLAGRFRPLHGHDQLIHGDLTTNVLFTPPCRRGSSTCPRTGGHLFSPRPSCSSTPWCGRVPGIPFSRSSATARTPCSISCAPQCSASSWTTCATPGAARHRHGGPRCCGSPANCATSLNRQSCKPEPTAGQLLGS
jgi:hypothetical protein